MKKFLLILPASLLISRFSFSYQEIFTNFTDTRNEVRLEESHIIGSFLNDSISNSTRNITVITSDEFKMKGIKTVAEALKSVPGITTRTMSGSEAIFDIRGQGDTASSNTILLLDGIPINTIDLSIPMTSNIPIDTIKRIEVIPGGGSVLYGDGSIGGIINIITNGTENTKNSGSLLAETSSYNSFRTNLKYNTKLNDRFLFNIDYTYNKNGGHRDNFEEILNSFSTNGVYLLDNGKIDFKASYSEKKFKLPGWLSEEEVSKNRKQSSDTSSQGEGDTKIYNYNLNYSSKISEKLEFINLFGYKESNYSSNNKQYFPPEFGSTGSWYYWKYYYDTTQLYIKPHLKYSYGKNNLLTFGIDYNNGTTDITKSEMTPTGKRKKDSMGGFVSNTFYLGNFQFSQGVRYEETEMDYKKSLTKEEDSAHLYNTAFEVGASYLFSETGTLFINYTSAFRTPNTDELALWLGDIKSQESQTYEIGFKNSFANTFISLSGYYKISDNEILYLPDYSLNGGWGSNLNLDGRSERIGGELLMEHYFDKLALRESYSYVAPKITSGSFKDKEFAGVPRTKITIGGTYSINDKINLNTDFNYLSNSYASGDFNNVAGKTNSYTTVDLSINYKFQNDFELYGGINNIFNKKYNEYIAYDSWVGLGFYPAKGRNFFLGAKKTF